jgi:hypothetical protein
VQVDIGPKGPTVSVWRKGAHGVMYRKYAGAKEEGVKDLVLRSLADVEEIVAAIE